MAAHVGVGVRAFRATALALLLVAGSAVPAAAGPGDLDRSWGQAGLARFTIPVGGEARNIALGPDGRIVVGACTLGMPALARYEPSGAIDRSFGVDGRVDLQVPGLRPGSSSDSQQDCVAGMLVRPDGRTVVAGSALRPEDSTRRIYVVQLQPDGRPDGSWGGDGDVVIDIPGERVTVVIALERMDDGRLVLLAGTADGMALARFTPEGELDPSFGEGGVVRNATDVVRGFAVQPDGRIVVVAERSDGSPDGWQLTRFRDDGAVDPTFGTAGTVVVPGGGSGTAAPSSVVFQPGTATRAARLVSAGRDDENVVVAAHLASDGSPDPTFGTGGLSRRGGFHVPSVRRLFTTAGGELLLAGSAGAGPPQAGFLAMRLDADGGEVWRRTGVVGLEGEDQSDEVLSAVQRGDGGLLVGGANRDDAATQELAVLALRPDGEPDRGFGRAGQILTGLFEASGSAEALAVAPDGGLLAAGWYSSFLYPRREGAQVVRLDGQGRVAGALRDFDFLPDALAIDGRGEPVAVGYSYGPLNAPVDSRRFAGVALPAALAGRTGVARAVAVAADGAILAGGAAAFGDHLAFALTRQRPSGEVDTDFGDGGLVVLDLGRSAIEAILPLPDGRIFVAGHANDHIAAAQFLPDGRPDPSFGEGGHVLLSEGAANAALRQADGRFVLGGHAPHARGFALTRLNADGSPDPTFGTCGLTVTQLSEPSDRHINSGINALVAEPDGRIVAAGSADGTSYFALARYDADGALDPTFGVGGRVRTRIPNNALVPRYDPGPSPGRRPRPGAASLARLPDGRLMVGGRDAGLSRQFFVVAAYEGGGPAAPPHVTPGCPKAQAATFGRATLVSSVLGRRGMRISRRRRSVRIGVRNRNAFDVRTTVYLNRGARRLGTRLARKGIRVGAARTRSVVLTLSRTQRRALARSRAGWRVILRLRVTDPAGRTRTVRRAARLRNG
jgi:uncharacterized delta-60 repeat protein